MATTQVDSTAALTTALQHAQGGDVILLAPGTYSGAAIKGLTIAGGVTVTSADLGRPAVLTNFNVIDSDGITFSHLEFAARAPAAFAFQVKESSDIHFDHISLHGSLDGDATNDANGLQVMDSSTITISNSEMQQLGRGLAISGSTNVTVSNNHVHDIRSDGMDFAQVGGVKVLGNVLSDFRPVAGDHPDAIQFWTRGTTSASHDIEISGNLIMRGDGETVQGVFMSDDTGALPMHRVTISDNLVINTGYNAIRVYGAHDLTVTGNELVTNTGDYKTFMLVEKADGVFAAGNRAVSIGFEEVTGLTQSNNVTTPFVSDGGFGALKSWIASHPDASFALSGLTSSANALLGDALGNVLAGASGADKILGGAGDDTLSDAGSANYLRGEDGDDMLTGGAGFDDLNGNAGNDSVYGGLGADWVVGGKDNDRLAGQDGDDLVYGNVGADNCDGGAGDDIVRGGQQDDTVLGGAGNDWLSGDRGSDVVTGGAGADVFHSFAAAGIDRVTDFNRAEGDHVMLDPGSHYSVAQVGADTVISITGGAQMILSGVQMASLSSGWIVVG